MYETIFGQWQIVSCSTGKAVDKSHFRSFRACNKQNSIRKWTFFGLADLFLIITRTHPSQNWQNWWQLSSNHTLRCTIEIRSIKNNPNFPSRRRKAFALAAQTELKSDYMEIGCPLCDQNFFSNALMNYSFWSSAKDKRCISTDDTRQMRPQNNKVFR